MADDMLYDIDGFNHYGYDREGYNRDGYNFFGRNRAGRTRAQEEKYIATQELLSKFGEPVSLMRKYLDGPVIELSTFAQENNIKKTELNELRKLAEKEDPSLILLIIEKNLRAQYLTINAMLEDFDLVLAGKLSARQFYNNNPTTNLKMMIDYKGETMAGKFIAIALHEIEDDDLNTLKNVDFIVRMFADDWYHGETAVVGLRTAERLPIPGIHSSRIIKLRDYVKSLKKFSRKDIRCRTSYDGGKTWQEYGDEEIDAAIEIVKSRRWPICNRTINVVLREFPSH